MVGIAPYAAPDLDWTAGMTKSNVDEFNAAVAGDQALTSVLEPALSAIREDPAGLLDSLESELSEPDRELLREQWLRDMLTVSFAEAVRTGIRGWVDDDLAFVAPWGFDPSTILAPTLLWHGADDVLAPASHTEWLDRAIPVANFVRPADTGHLGAFAAQGYVLSWLLGDDAAPRRRA
jgi:pimeloyl-ACP methyl ester carboxylesterase